MPNDQSTTIPILGVPVRFRTNDLDVLTRIEASFGQWRQLSQWRHLISPKSISVEVQVIAQPSATGNAAVDYRLPNEHRVEFSAGASRGVADAATGRAVIKVTDALLNDGARFGYGVLEGLTLFLVSKTDRQPLHAAAVRRGDAAILLAAPAGTGKSSVAFATARSELAELISDDAVYVSLAQTPCLWGVPGRTYLPEDMTRLFGELTGDQPVRLPSGKEKVPVSTAYAWRRPPTATRVCVCLLERGEPGAELTPVSPNEIVRALVLDLAPQRILYPATLEAAAQWVAGPGGWRLALSGDPGDAVALLGQVLDALEAK